MKHLVLFFVVAAGLLSGAPALPRPVGNMTFDSAKGKISMSQFKGKVTVVMFFHTECTHCESMTKVLSQVLRERRDDFQVVGVAVDEEPTKVVPAFVKKLGITFPVGWVAKEAFFKYTDLPSNTRPFIPVVLFVDKDFQINRQYSQDHGFFKNELTNVRGVVNMLVRTAPGKAKDLPRTTAAPVGAAPKKP